MVKLPVWVPDELRGSYAEPNPFMLRIFSDPRTRSIVETLRDCDLQDRQIVDLFDTVASWQNVFKGGVNPWERASVSERNLMSNRFARACREAEIALGQLNGMWMVVHQELQAEGHELAATLLKVMAGFEPNATGIRIDATGESPLTVLAKHADNWPRMFVLGAGRDDSTRALRAAVITIYDALEPFQLVNWASLASRIAAVMFPNEREFDEREVRRIVRLAEGRRKASAKGQK